MNETTIQFDSNPEIVHKWPYFLVPAFVILFSGIIIIVTYRLVRSCLKRTGHIYRKAKERSKVHDVAMANRRSQSSVTQEAFLEGLFSPGNEDDNLLHTDGNIKGDMMSKLMMACEELLSAQTPTGAILAIFSCMFALASLIVYFVDASTYKSTEFERRTETTTDIIDLACNIFFLIHFIFRFVASNDKLRCWIQLNSVVDIFTIVPIFVGFYLKRRWLGIRFICAFRLLNFPDVLQFLRILQNSTHIRLVELISLFFCVWLTSSGFVHLVENGGDFFNDYQNYHSITYGECMYFIIITMSTVGYGDYSCTTVTGKAFIVLFIFGAVALFASQVPEIIDIVNSYRQNYLTEYKKEIGFRHIIVGGHISLKTVKNFIRDFTHDDRTKNNLKGIFISSIEPTLEIENVFKQLFTRLVFVKGSMMNAADLKRVRLADAEAVLILSDQLTSTPESDDTDNIMRAIAVKNFRPKVRIILQLIKVENKIICSNLPCWLDTDNIICFNEMKMGYMAAGCLAPGFSTFLTNLLFMLSHDGSTNLLPWQEDYMKGAEMEAYTEKFSTFFYGRPLPEVIEFCYIRLRLLLVAVSNASDKNNNVQNIIILNPGHEYRVCSQTIGFFICPSEDDCQCVRHYCLKCHCNITAESIKACQCLSTDIYKSLLSAEIIGGFGENRGRNARSGIFHIGEELAEEADEVEVTQIAFRESDGSDESEIFDATGYFYWCTSKTFEESILDGNSVLSNHIILCFSDSSRGSLRNFILPLRASCFSYTRLKTIVVVGEDEAKLRNEWPSVAHFPKILVKIGSLMNRGFLRSIHIEACHMCVILSSNHSNQSPDSTTSFPNDSRALLATLNINNMVSPTLSDQSQNSDALRVLYNQSYERQCSAVSMVTHSGSNSTIPILTELTKDENVHLLSENVSDAYVPFHLNHPFACGKTFAPRVIDALTPTIFFSPATYKLIRMFVNWTDSEEHEQLMAEGLLGGNCSMSADKLQTIRNRCGIDLLPLSKGILEPFLDSTFERLLVNVLQQHHILCLGLYRFIGFYDKQNYSDDRFVITNPPPDFKLDKSDLVYCLCPLNKSKLFSEAINCSP